MAYIACLESLGHTVFTESSRLADAETAILHDDPLTYGPLFARLPELAKSRCIAYCVWENEKLTPHYIPHLRLASEIWTPSAFSCRSIAAAFQKVRVLPHVVERIVPTPEERAFAADSMRSNEAGFRFFSIVDSINPRKNVRALLAAFSSLRSIMSRKPLLFLKQYRVDFDYSGIPGVISISGDLTDGQMAALHMRADAYVSAHHAEGWGLGLSTAMAYGKPVIATGYSGNMDFMDTGNSFPVPYRMVPVSEEMCKLVPLFSRDMHWAEIDREALVKTMHQVAKGELPPDLPRNAARITRRFGRERTTERLRELLA
jgi:glycosyltransferase involved in cell wall biosynthesis